MKDSIKEQILAQVELLRQREIELKMLIRQAMTVDTVHQMDEVEFWLTANNLNKYVN